MTQIRLLHLMFHFVSILYETNGFFMKMLPIDSPHLQILPQSFSIIEQNQFLVNISLSRAFQAQKRDSRLALNSIQSTLSHLQGNYFVTQLSVGDIDSPLSPFVILDTFSDLTWIQCANCISCFPLKDKFSVESSPSYVRMSVDDRRCTLGQNYNGSCGFEASLGNGHTQGYLGKDTFAFQSPDNMFQFFPNVAFGCGIENKNFIFYHNVKGDNIIAGVIGLSPGPKSFITQLDQTIKSRFSFCIPPSKGNATFSFGDDAQISGDDTRKVQTIAFVPSSRYHLYLAAIILNGIRLHIDPTLFVLDDQDYKTGFFIDPSSPVTVLTEIAYYMVRGSMADYFWLKYGWGPILNPLTFDLCYPNQLSGFQEYPKLAFNFLKSPGDVGEIQLVIPPENLFVGMGPEGGFCLQMASSRGPSIFGALQLVNHRFLFDLKTELLSFVPEKC